MSFNLSAAGFNLVMFFGLVVGSGLIGHWLAKALRSADYGLKFAIILFAILASAVVVLRGWPPKLGVDLGGGSILVYKVDETKTVWRPDKMDSLIASISKRVNPGGQKEIAVRSLGTDMVQIVMPSVSGSTAQEKQVEADEIRKIIRTTGALEFRIVATKRDNESMIEMAKTERKKFPVNSRKTVTVSDPKTGRELGKWCTVRKSEADKLKNDEAALLVGKAERPGEKDDPEMRVEVFVLSPESDAYNVTGGDVRDARASTDEYAKPEVLFSFNPAGGAKFGRLTGEHVPNGNFKYRLAIVLDDVLITAPTINSVITDNGRITGDFTPQEVNEIVGYINAGSLPAALEPTPVRDMTTEATLGAETIRQSKIAMIIASIVVPLFMLYYYRFAGLVAVLGLALNMLMLVALMILVKAPFTLPALAGLALTVGMDVDNNVLIYERLREELSHGAALRMAIRNAFHRVGVVIIDANITHIIAAAVLYVVGTEQIKGFAVTFLLGAVLSIWATMFVARLIFEVAERRRWIQRVNMMQWIGHTKIDFMAWFPACATFSVVITVVGLVIAVVRGQGLFDIDFTGGVSVQTVFQQEQKIDEIRDQINKIAKDLPDATVTNAHSQDEPDNQRFIIDTSNSKREEVENLLKKLFGEKLVTLELTAAPFTPEKPASKAPASKAEEMKPAENKPADSKPVDVKPAEDKPKQSRIDLPSLSLVAMAGPGAVLLAQADSPAVKATADPKTDSKPEPKADARPEVKPEPKADAKSEVKPEPKADVKPEAKSVPKPEAKPEPKADVKPESKPQPKSEAEAENKPQTKVDSAAVASASPQSFQAALTFSSTVAKLIDGKAVQQPQPVRYDEDRLKKLIEQALEENKVSIDLVRIELNAPEGVKKSDRWDLKLAPNAEAKNPLTPAKFQSVLATLESGVRSLPYFPIVDNIGSAVANDTKFWAVVALVTSWSLIILYLWIRFQGVAFGLAAVIALIHDVLVMLGAIAFSTYLWSIPGLSFITGVEPFKINLPIVAAFLTIIGYSVNDTIVVFDRIREIRGKSLTLTRQMVNDATNQTLSRTVLTSFTVMLVVIILYIFGGQAVHGFAFALIIGVLTGTYSSIYVAAPILLWLLHPKEMKAVSASDTPAQSR